MNAVLLRKGGRKQQLAFDFGEETRAMETRWRDAEEGEKRSRARFAQNAIKPEEVAPEWKRWRELLGDSREVYRFAERAFKRLNAPLEPTSGAALKAHLAALPKALGERLSGRGYEDTTRVSFEEPVPSKAQLLNRSHPIVATLADYLLESALDHKTGELPLGRAGAWTTAEVEQLTTVALLRLRFKLVVHGRKEQMLLVEEANAIAFDHQGNVISTGEPARALLEAEAASNLAPIARDRMINGARERMKVALNGGIAEFARSRAEVLADDHGRVAASSEAAIELANKLNTNLNALRAVRDMILPVQVVPAEAPLEEAIDIFDRINSQGTKLTDAELALTHITAKWPQARRTLKEKMDFSAKQGFDFGLTFMTRAMVTAVTGRALFELVHTRPSPELQTGWSTLTKALDYLMSVLPSAAYIHGTEDLNTTNALIPLVAYLARNNGTFPTQKSKLHAVNWLYSALTWARYTAQTDQRLEADLSVVAKEVEPWAEMRSNIVEQRGRIEVRAVDFEGRTAQHPLYRMVFILAKAHGGVDWFNGVPLGNTVGAAYALHSHHIFPQALLYRNGFDADNYVHRQLVNEIGNRAFLTAASNIPLGDAEPAEYLPQIEAKYPGALAKQFIPMDPSLWRVDRYADFLAARRELLAKKLNSYLASLIDEPDVVRHRPISELVKLGESAVLEFKSTLQWDVVQNQPNKGLRKSCLKTIAAFMNTEGGTLLIGIADDGTAFGLDKDLGIVGGSEDVFQQTLVNMVGDGIGPSYSYYYRIRFETTDEKRICVVEVDPVRDGVFVKSDGGKEFFIRSGNTTRSLDPADTVAYLAARQQQT